MPQSTSVNPRVAVGVPAYNGERYIATAIDSILNQTYSDFELIISDDASSDGTEEICRDYARRDQRVKYYRNEHNIGAGPNFNHAFELASTEYFKWAAQDDVVEPDFLRRCVTALDENPDAVLCQSLVGLIDAVGQQIGVYDNGMKETEKRCPSNRFAATVLTHHMAMEIFGLIRTEQLAATARHGNWPRSDSALVAELALRGPFVRLPEVLFMNRDHPDRYMRTVMANAHKALLWHDPEQHAKRVLPSWRLYKTYWRMVNQHVAARGERLRCYLHLARWPVVNWNLVRLAVDLLSLVDPRIGVVALNAKHKLIGSVSPAIGRTK